MNTPSIIFRMFLIGIAASFILTSNGIMNFGCYMCHGDGEEEFYPRPGSERCISCHSDQEVDFSKTSLNNCFDCHQGHSLKFHHSE